MHTYLPPYVYDDAGTLNEQRDADDGRNEERHVGIVEDVHEVEIAADIDEVWHYPLVLLAKFYAAPAMYATIDECAERRQTERKDQDKCKQPQFEPQREETQVGKKDQDEHSDCRVVRRPKD